VPDTEVLFSSSKVPLTTDACDQTYKGCRRLWPNARHWVSGKSLDWKCGLL